MQDFKCKAKEHALEATPQEACGVLVDNTYYPCRNLADKPNNDFILDPKDYLKARAKGKIQAIIHSHPEGQQPSFADKKACARTKLPWYIYLVPEDKWLTINP